MRTPAKLAVTVAATAGALVLASSPAYAGAPAAQPSQLHIIKTLSSSFVGPLQFAVARRSVFVADSFTSTLSVIGRSTPIATGPDSTTGGDLAGVAVDAATHALAYTTSTGDHSVTQLTILRPGAKPVVADLSGFEKRRNPDRKITYGVVGSVPQANQACVLAALTAGGVPGASAGSFTYPGQVDSHPYAVTSLGKGSWAVADAGGNDLLRVDRWGHVSLISVFPAQTATITQALADANQLPSCTVGLRYRFEAVPTDVEVGQHGALYVTTLPGGLEGPDNPGSVYRVQRWGGHPRQVATGFAGATNLAIDSRGGIYVAEIASGMVAKVVRGKPVEVLLLPGVVAVEWANGHLYASTAPLASGGQGPGTIVELGFAGKKG
jgi:hypothetical protein